MSEKIQELQRIIAPILEKNGVVKASVFGSFARGDDKPDSDIDLLVELDEPKGLLFLAGLKFDLEDATGRQIDLLTYGAVNPRLEQHIYKDEVKIYG
jgi:hypothetical protein